jgi:hypothetical protein
MHLSVAFSAECVEVEVPELRLYGVLRSYPPVAADDDHGHTQDQEHGTQHHPVRLLSLLTLTGQVESQPPLQSSSLAHVGASEIVTIDEHIDPDQKRDQAITQGVVH